MKYIVHLTYYFLLLVISTHLNAQDTTGTSALFDLSIKDLLKLSVVTSAKWEQKITETSTKVVVVTQNDIKLKGYHDLFDLITSLSTFQIQSQHGHWTKGGIVNFQGLRSGDSGNNKILILIDGVEMNDAGGEGVFLGLNSIPLNAVKQVEIVSAPNSTLYGRDAFGGMINIITRSENEAYAGYSFGTYNSQRVYGGIFHRFSNDMSGSLTYTTYKSDEQDPTSTSLAYKLRSNFPKPPYTERFYRASDNKYLGIKFSYKDLSLSYNLFDIETSETYGSNPNLYVTEYSTQLAFTNQILSLNYARSFSNLFNISTSLLWKLNQFHPRTANLYIDDLNRGVIFNPIDSSYKIDPLYAYGGRKYYYFRTESYKYKLSNRAVISDRLKNISGVEVEAINGIPIISEGKGGKPITTVSQKNSLEHSFKNWGVFSEFNYDINNNLKISLGGRLDQHSLHEITFMPRAALIYNIEQSHSFRLALSRGYIAPSVTQSFFESITNFSWIKKNDDLKAEKNTSYQIDYTYLTKNLTLEAGLFYNKLEDAIIESVTTGDSSFVTIGKDKFWVPILMSQNASSGNRFGFNLSLEKVLTNNFTARLNYSFISGSDEILDEKIDVDKNLISNHKLVLDVIGKIEKLSFYGEMIWRSKKSIKSTHLSDSYAPLLDKNGYLNFDAIFCVNINARYNNIYRGLSVYAKIRNLFDKEYYGQTINAQWGSPLILQDLRRIDLGFEYEL